MVQFKRWTENTGKKQFPIFSALTHTEDHKCALSGVFLLMKDLLVPQWSCSVPGGLAVLVLPGITLLSEKIVESYVELVLQ